MLQISLYLAATGEVYDTDVYIDVVAAAAVGGSDS